MDGCTVNNFAKRGLVLRLSSSRISGLDATAVHVEFVVDKVTMIQVSLLILRFSLVIINQQILHIQMYWHEADAMEIIYSTSISKNYFSTITKQFAIIYSHTFCRTFFCVIESTLKDDGVKMKTVQVTWICVLLYTLVSWKLSLRFRGRSCNWHNGCQHLHKPTITPWLIETKSFVVVLSA
jgi:hypothetical protein